ncbi:MAG: 3-oxoacyl-ACP reductase [Deltaproteobacteria bacterium]|nr:3-oxoacyl-ACP reductase [Deltaproteobacteria bacterium]
MQTEIAKAFDLADRVAVVTGAASGIGRAASILFAKAGANIVIADRSGDALSETASEISKLGRQVVPVVMDVSNRSEVEALIGTAIERFQGIDIMANVAGIMRGAMFLDVTEEDLDALIAVNQKGVFFGCQAAGRAMAERGGGSIINIASAGMDSPAPNISVYAMTKAAVAMMTRSLATELGPQGVRVNTVAPGFTDTGMTQRHWIDGDGKENLEARDSIWSQMSERVPLGSIGQPEDIAFAMLYLASDASRFVTGQVLRPNGGVAMP